MDEDEWQREMLRAQDDEMWEMHRRQFGWTMIGIFILCASFFCLWIWTLL